MTATSCPCRPRRAAASVALAETSAPACSGRAQLALVDAERERVLPPRARALAAARAGVHAEPVAVEVVALVALRAERER